MRSVRLICLLILWGVVQCQAASAEVYHPDFDCSRAHEEATRPIDDHIALQRKLQALGFLPSEVVPDGVYGDATRRAILRWQEQASQPNRDGFLGNDDALSLMPELATETSTQGVPPPPRQRQEQVLTGLLLLSCGREGA